MCARCKMAISEKRYAAEVIDRDGNALKFDDIGCMTSYVADRVLRDTAAALFVMDYESRQWLEAAAAHYVKSEEIRSPMASGWIALRERSKAEEFAVRFHGRTMSFDDLWKK